METDVGGLLKPGMSGFKVQISEQRVEGFRELESFPKKGACETHGDEEII